jgi:predicted Zn-dependent protease
VKSMACIVAAVALAVSGCQQTRQAGRQPILTVGQEIEIGRAAAPVLEGRLGGRLEPAVLQAYVQTVGERIARSAGGEFTYRFAAVDSPRVGAFSLPGGPVYVTRGLLARLDTEGELAAVLAHQVAHSIAGHDVPRVGEAFGTRVLMDAASAAASARQSPSASPQAAAGLARLVVGCTELAYTTDMESDADALALDYMAAAGYHPGEMIRVAAFLETMQGRDAVEFQGLHPNPANRARDVGLAVSRKYPGRAGRIGREEYQRVVLDHLKKP